MNDLVWLRQVLASFSSIRCKIGEDLAIDIPECKRIGRDWADR
jgi:hypothetical protein